MNKFVKVLGLICFGPLIAVMAAFAFTFELARCLFLGVAAWVMFIGIPLQLVIPGGVSPVLLAIPGVITGLFFFYYSIKEQIDETPTRPGMRMSDTLVGSSADGEKS